MASTKPNRALGDVLPLIQNGKPYRDAKGYAFLAAYSSVQQDGRRQASRDLVLRQATRRFGPDARAAATIASLTEPKDLETLVQRILSAADWKALLDQSDHGDTCPITRRSP